LTAEDAKEIISPITFNILFPLVILIAV